MTDIRDILGGGGHMKRPDHPDFWRVSEIMLELKAEILEARTMEAKEKVWRARIDKSIDFDVLAYHATQMAIQILGLETGADLARMRNNRQQSAQFASVMQAFYDGFLIGVEFERRGGKQ